MCQMFSKGDMSGLQAGWIFIWTPLILCHACWCYSFWMWFSIVLPYHNKRGLSLERTSSGWQRVLLHNFYIIAGRLLTVTNAHEREAIDGPQLKRKACIKSLSLLLGDHTMPEQPERALAITSIHPFTHFLNSLPISGWWRQLSSGDKCSTTQTVSQSAWGPLAIKMSETPLEG